MVIYISRKALISFHSLLNYVDDVICFLLAFPTLMLSQIRFVAQKTLQFEECVDSVQ